MPRNNSRENDTDICIAVNCVHDLILTILPIMILKDLKMNLRIKIILSVLMGMSVL